MCEHGDTVPMWLPSEHPPGWRMWPVDRCIAPLVAALRSAGYETTGSCCGHGKRDGAVLLADGAIVLKYGAMVAAWIDAIDLTPVEGEQT